MLHVAKSKFAVVMCFCCGNAEVVDRATKETIDPFDKTQNMMCNLCVASCFTTAGCRKFVNGLLQRVRYETTRV